MDTLQSGVMTGDLIPLAEQGFETRKVNSVEFLEAVAARL